MTGPYDVQRDTLHAAFGSPAIKPSMLSALERAFEGLEENAFEKGMEFERTKESEKLLMLVLEEMELDNPGAQFDREKWKAGLKRALSREDEKKKFGDIPF